MTGFGSAFAAARKAGKKVFTWNGKEYNTELKETSRPKARPKAEASVMSPKARPKASVMAPKAKPSKVKAKTKVAPAPEKKKGVVKPEPGWMERKLGRFQALRGR